MLHTGQFGAVLVRVLAETQLTLNKDTTPTQQRGGSDSGLLASVSLLLPCHRNTRRTRFYCRRMSSPVENVHI
jgi:hypothetical protein